MRNWLIALVLVLPPVSAAAQTPTGRAPLPNFPSPLNPFPRTGTILQGPSTFPHPTMPWGFATHPEVYGPVIGYREVPAQQLTVELPVASAETQPFRLAPQLVAIPGYVVTETANGYLYPERWTIEQLNVGVYQWRLLPAEYVRK